MNIFQKIEQKAKDEKRNRYITSISSIQTIDDMKEYLIYLQDYLEKVEERIKKLEIK